MEKAFMMLEQAVRDLLALKDLKEERIETGLATEEERRKYYDRRGAAWQTLREILSVYAYDFPSALQSQIGGGHYRTKTIQPVEYWHANKLDAFQGAVVKYVTRHREKNRAEDLKKAIHYIQLYLELEYGVRSKMEYSEPRKVL